MPGTQTARSEFNWWSDPEAADFVMHAHLDLRLVPLDVTRRIAIPGSAIRALGKAGESDQQARFWADALRFYADFHQEYEHFDGCIVNDALAVALVADPSLAGWEEMRLDVSLSDDDERGAVRRSADGARTAVATSVRASDVLALLERTLFARWLAPGSLAQRCGGRRSLARERRAGTRMSPAAPFAILGAGEIGSGWAALFASYGAEVRIVDPNPRALDRAHDALACARTLRRSAVSGRIVRSTTIADAVRGAVWVQESVPEGLELKRTVLAQLEGVLAQDAIVASSTSTLGATVLSEGRSFASRIVGGAPAGPGVRGAGG